jgi:hypothetical protein
MFGEFDKLLLTEFLALLPPLRTNEGNQFQLYMYMSGSQSTDEGRSSDRVRELWVQRLCLK